MEVSRRTGGGGGWRARFGRERVMNESHQTGCVIRRENEPNEDTFRTSWQQGKL